MSSAAAVRRPRGPELGRNTLPSFVAAVAMHALLIAGMWFAVQWRTTSEAPAVAELWEPLTPIQPPAPPPEPPAPPQPEAARPDADIVQQQQVKPHAPEQESPPPVQQHPIEKPLPRKVEPKKVEPKKPSPAEIERQQREVEQRRQAEIARVTGQASGTARALSASPGAISDSYKALINGCIRPHIVFAVPEGTSDQVYAEFKVDLLPTGEQAAPPRLIKPSGLSGYDDAADRAIIQCDPFPRDRDGTVPRSFTLRMYPTDPR
jgi:colicin import membrane protein